MLKRCLWENNENGTDVDILQASIEIHIPLIFFHKHLFSAEIPCADFSRMFDCCLSWIEGVHIKQGQGGDSIGFFLDQYFLSHSFLNIFFHIVEFLGFRRKLQKGETETKGNVD